MTSDSTSVLLTFIDVHYSPAWNNPRVQETVDSVVDLIRAEQRRGHGADRLHVQEVERLYELSTEAFTALLEAASRDGFQAAQATDIIEKFYRDLGSNPTPAVHGHDQEMEELYDDHISTERSAPLRLLQPCPKPERNIEVSAKLLLTLIAEVQASSIWSRALVPKIIDIVLDLIRAQNQEFVVPSEENRRKFEEAYKTLATMFRNSRQGFSDSELTGKLRLHFEKLNEISQEILRKKHEITGTNPSGDSKLDRLVKDLAAREHASDSRTIVLCFDGTQNQISDNLSNVAKFFAALDRRHPNKQPVYYQAGIGTYTTSQFMPTLAMTLDSMFATSISTHVKEGYQFLMDKYTPGDKICIFGFSRGAYTARVLVSMLHKVGLLPSGNHQHLKYAWETFLELSEVSWTRFRNSFSIDIEVEFVGIWDSVGSVGLSGFNLPIEETFTTIKTFRHALALDERRARFQANVWAYKSPLTPGDAARLQSPRDSHDTRVLEVWFAGCHSDIGGGNDSADVGHSLSRIPLRWMVLECLRARTGIRFSNDALVEMGLDPSTFVPKFPAYPSVTAKDDEDCESSINDELEKHPAWWVIELLPMRVPEKNQKGVLEQWPRSNFGRARQVKPIYIHHSVQQKRDRKVMNANPYRPKVDFDDSSVQWVDSPPNILILQG